MKGLLYKDLFAIVKHFKSYLFLILIFMAASWFDPENLFYSMYPCILTGSIIVSLISMDESSKWNMTCGFLPYTQTRLVCAKYLVGLIMTGVFFAVTLGFQAVRMAVQSVIVWEELTLLAGMLIACGFLMPGIMLPLVFRFGVEKGRLAYMVVMGGSAGLLVYFSSSGSVSGYLLELPMEWIGLGAMALYGLSCLISIGICKRKNG